MKIGTYTISVVDFRKVLSTEDVHEALKAELDSEIENAIQSAVSAIAGRFNIGIEVKKS